jgi:hypothetical protein
MPREVNLLTNQNDFEKLHALADRRGTMVSLERQILTQLLVDHSVLVTACKGAGVRITEPKPHRERPRLK